MRQRNTGLNFLSTGWGESGQTDAQHTFVE